METTVELTGGCLCGAARYEYRGRAPSASYCHCEACRKATGGPYTVGVGDSRSVTAVTDYSLPAGCSIIWTAWPGGVVSFSNPTAYSVTATFVDSGEGVQIGARTSCMGYSRWTLPFDVVELDVVVPSADTAGLCEDVVFYAFTQPTGYQGDVAWSAPQGDPNSGTGSSFTTHWKCKGNKTVTATYCGYVNESVSVIVPTECDEGPERVRFVTDTTVNCPGCSSHPEYGGCWNEAEPHRSGYTDVRYDNCQWVWDVNVVFYDMYDVCFDNFVNVCDINDVALSNRNEQYLAYVIGILIDPNDNGYDPNANCWICSNAHEQTHHDAWADEISDAADQVPIDPAMDPIGIDCLDPNTTHCDAVEKAYEGDLQDVIDEILADAYWAGGNAEADAQQAAQLCSENVACVLCDYAASQGWNIPDCNCCL